jgi:alpha-glucosidase
MFGPHTFVHPANSTIPNASTTDAPSLLAHFHKDINMRFSGIRKPRTYSNQALSNASGWLLPNSFDVGAGDNNWNMSAPGWSDWYVANHLHFLKDGIDFWWNDEGETQWFTYTWWNAAQKAMVEEVLPGTRHFTINRSFQAGMQSYPAISWTGDRQDCSHKTVLTFTTAGQLYTACDMTAPSASVLVRQYQNAVFLPIMRTHAMHGTPRFPFLWGAGAEAGFRAALNARYHFLPHIYSLMHLARRTGQPLALPASYVFPSDPAFPVAVGDATYMFSDVLLPADVSTSNGPDPDENTTHVNIPSGTWFAFNSTATLVGPILDLTYTDVPLDQLVLFVRAGAVLALNRDVIQYSDAVGGALELHVYAGRDGAFELVEDDGETLAYATDYEAATRRTSFVWADATRTLSWTVAGGFNEGRNLFLSAAPVLFVSNASAPVFAAVQTLGVAGSVTF